MMRKAIQRWLPRVIVAALAVAALAAAPAFANGPPQASPATKASTAEMAAPSGYQINALLPDHLPKSQARLKARDELFGLSGHNFNTDPNMRMRWSEGNVYYNVYNVQYTEIGGNTIRSARIRVARQADNRVKTTTTFLGSKPIKNSRK